MIVGQNPRILQSTVGVYLADSNGRGKGVFAARDFPAGALIERAPVIVLPDPEWVNIESTSLKNHYFCWGQNAIAVVLGFGMLYNHSYQPNAALRYLYSEEIIEFYGLRDITAGEEIFYNYGEEDSSPMWFDVV